MCSDQMSQISKSGDTALDSPSEHCCRPGRSLPTDACIFVGAALVSCLHVGMRVARADAKMKRRRVKDVLETLLLKNQELHEGSHLLSEFQQQRHPCSGAIASRCHSEYGPFSDG